jgi:hypothetical protein
LRLEQCFIPQFLTDRREARERAEGEAEIERRFARVDDELRAARRSQLQGWMKRGGFQAFKNGD